MTETPTGNPSTSPGALLAIGMLEKRLEEAEHKIADEAHAMARRIYELEQWRRERTAAENAWRHPPRAPDVSIEAAPDPEVLRLREQVRVLLDAHERIVGLKVPHWQTHSRAPATMDRALGIEAGHKEAGVISRAAIEAAAKLEEGETDG